MKKCNFIKKLLALPGATDSPKKSGLNEKEKAFMDADLVPEILSDAEAREFEESKKTLNDEFPDNPFIFSNCTLMNPIPNGIPQIMDFNSPQIPSIKKRIKNK